MKRHGSLLITTQITKEGISPLTYSKVDETRTDRFHSEKMPLDITMTEHDD